ncbi:MAG: glycosyltransferase family 4 protein [Pseudomonadota bacterium]|nr:glycosyltransferase family 4 protein [Pseudomonadota bacterium]
MTFMFLDDDSSSSSARGPGSAGPPGGEIVQLHPLRAPHTRGGVVRRVALIGTFAPRQCGIATFTSDVFAQLGEYHPEIALEVYALDDGRKPLAYDNVRQVIAAEQPQSYLEAARSINEADVDAVWLQHEFGIYGGPNGEMVCDFVDRLAAPLIVTFHTVLSEPSERQARIMCHLIKRASRIMVMSEHARRLLMQVYLAPAETVEVIAHGAPDRPFGREALFKRELGLNDCNVLMTFGLIGPGKGLEHMIDAMPAIVARHPRTVYRIVGATHPKLVEEQGETYRQTLIAKARELGVEAHIIWDDRFLETCELLDQLEACDIYVTPYLNLQQATSGTLSYAVALGKAVVSTPYVHARELLADGVGVLVEPASTSAFAEAVIHLLDDPDRLAAIQRRAYARGRATIWPQFAAASAALVGHAVRPRALDVPFTATPGMTAVFAMSDATGMMQHAIGIIADRRHGYCLDDNVRALMLMNVASGLSAAERMKWSVIYASFIQHAWNEDRKCFRNFMRFDRTWCEDAGSEDSNGRTLWTLGHTVERAGDADLRRWAQRWFDEALPGFETVDSPRAVAFAMLGACAVIRATGGVDDGRNAAAMQLVERGGAMLHRLLDQARRPDWAWFETVLGYDNPRLSQALLEAGALCGRAEWVEAGLHSLNWIAERQTAPGGYFRPVGSETFGHDHAQLPFDQQPLEAQAAIDAAAAAYDLTGDERWVAHGLAAYRWFFGANDRGAVLVDLASGRCRDGVTPRGFNENCGAESILAFHLAHGNLMGLLGKHRYAAAQGE